MSLRRVAARTRSLSAVGLVLVLAGCGGGSGGGEVHALGDPVEVGYNDATDTGGRGADTTLEITVLAVRKGSQEDLTDAGFEVDAEDRSAVPYYVDARYENTGDATVERNIDVSLEDSDGNLIGSTLVFDYGEKGFPPCESVDEGKFAPGDSDESCTLFLVPEGIEVGRVSFLSDSGADAEPEFVYWEAD